MDIERFHILTEPQKMYYTRKIGVYLGTLQDQNAMVHFYAVLDYYVEIIFPLQNQENYYSRAFTSIANLEPFLQSIDIGYLFQ